MGRKCKGCGHLSGCVSTKDEQELYENLYQCIICGKDYFLKDGEFKFISKAEFKRIVGTRKNKIGA